MLIGLACSPVLSDAHGERLALAAHQCTDWPALVNQLGPHRLGPLLHWQFRQYGIPSPPEIRRTLAGMYARQIPIAAAQQQALVEITRALDSEGISSVILKGGALAHTVYAEPALRPMEDLDILVRPTQLESARQVLQDLGFSAPPPHGRFERLMHQLPLALRKKDGVVVAVEIHRSVLNFALGGGPDFDHVRRPLYRYPVADAMAQTLHPTEFLHTQLRALRLLTDPFRALRLADLVGWAERMVDTIEWERYPGMVGSLEALNSVSAFSTPLCKRLGLNPDPPQGPDPSRAHYRGWPLFPFADAEGGLGKHLARTLAPPDWWSRLVYGVPSGASLTAVRWLHHPANLISQGLRRLRLGPLNSRRFFRRRL